MDRYYLVPEKTFLQQLQEGGGVPRRGSTHVWDEAKAGKRETLETAAAAPPSYNSSITSNASNPIVLNLPKYMSPLEALQQELESLNHDKSLSNELRWRKFETIFQKYFQHTVGTTSHTGSPDSTQTDAGTGEKAGDWNLKTNDIASLLFRGRPNGFDRFRILLLDALASLPPTLRQKGSHLMLLVARHISSIRESPSGFGFSELGQLKSNTAPIDDKGMEGTNIKDLLHFAVRRKRNVFQPVGWRIFEQLLQDSNIPPKLWRRSNRSTFRTKFPSARGGGGTASTRMRHRYPWSSYWELANQNGVLDQDSTSTDLPGDSARGEKVTKATQTSPILYSPLQTRRQRRDLVARRRITINKRGISQNSNSEPKYPEKRSRR